MSIGIIFLHNWSVPRDWIGERCLIIAGGESVIAAENDCKKFQGRVIAIKQSVEIRPNADVMFIAGKDDGRVCAKFFPMFKGQYIIARGQYKDVPERTKILNRTKDASQLSMDPTELAGFDAGTSAINLAFLFGCLEILLIGYDMRGGRWLNGKHKHHLPFPPQRDFDAHLSILPDIAKSLKNLGVRVINCSPISEVKVFEKCLLKEFV